MPASMSRAAVRLSDAPWRALARVRTIARGCGGPGKPAHRERLEVARTQVHEVPIHVLDGPSLRSPLHAVRVPARIRRSLRCMCAVESSCPSSKTQTLWRGGPRPHRTRRQCPRMARADRAASRLHRTRRGCRRGASGCSPPRAFSRRRDAGVALERGRLTQRQFICFT